MNIKNFRFKIGNKEACFSGEYYPEFGRGDFLFGDHFVPADADIESLVIDGEIIDADTLGNDEERFSYVLDELGKALREAGFSV